MMNQAKNHHYHIRFCREAKSIATALLFFNPRLRGGWGIGGHRRHDWELVFDIQQ
jgi:hypothetical protein